MHVNETEFPSVELTLCDGVVKTGEAIKVHLTITNKITLFKHSYSIYDQQLQQLSSAKYLGVTIDSHLTWKDHINDICSKDNSAKAFLQRNIYQCPKAIKSSCYKSLVRPILEYAAPVWCPLLQCQTYQIEKIQSSMAHFVMNDNFRYSSATNMMNHLFWPTLASRRNYLKLILFYKIEKEFVETTVNLIPLSTVTRGHPCCYIIPPIRTETFANSFLPSTTKLWNELPEPLVMIDNLHLCVYTLCEVLHSNNNPIQKQLIAVKKVRIQVKQS